MKRIIFFGLGLVVGAGIGVLATRGHYRKLAFDEINEAREAFRNMKSVRKVTTTKTTIKTTTTNKSGNEEQETEPINGEDPEKTGKTGKLVQNSSKKDDFNRYSEIIEPYTGDDSGPFKHNYNVFSNPPDPNNIDISEDEENETDDPYEITVDHESPKEGGYSAPYHITEEEFASDKMFYDKVMIEYYNDGVAVLEDSDQIIDCVEDLVGPDILREDIADKWIYNDNETYVRNDSRSTDYGIIFTGTNFVPKEAQD